MLRNLIGTLVGGAAILTMAIIVTSLIWFAESHGISVIDP